VKGHTGKITLYRMSQDQEHYTAPPLPDASSHIEVNRTWYSN